jgi:hypothetical protein
MSITRTPPHVKAHATGRWAETICRVLGTRTGRRWRFVSFRGTNRAEWRGVVDVIAIRKRTAQPAEPILKRGDLFEIILIQVKGGSARGPTDDDCARLRKIAAYYHAKDIVQFQWKRAESSQFLRLERGPRWQVVEPASLFR